MLKITVYTANPCPYCSRAKGLLAARGLSFEEIKLDWDDEASFKELEAKTHMKTVPQIFFGDTCIGGYTELAALDASGQLMAKLGT